MSNQNKVPWPGLIALQKCCLFYNGWISDRSGADAINAWKTTATPAELEQCNRQAYSLGYFTGYAIGYFAVDAIFKLFGATTTRNSHHPLTKNNYGYDVHVRPISRRNIETLWKSKKSKLTKPAPPACRIWSGKGQ